jgi:hypothetical protein
MRSRTSLRSPTSCVTEQSKKSCFFALNQFNYERDYLIRQCARPVVFARVRPPKHRQAKLHDACDDIVGWGADLNLEKMAKHPYNPNNFFPLFREEWEKRGRVLQ